MPAIGCVPGPGVVRLVQRTGEADRLVVGERAFADADPGDLGSAIRRAIAEGAFTGKRVVTRARPTSLRCRPLRVAALAPGDLELAVRWRFAQQLGLDPETISTDHLDMGAASDRGAPGRDLLVFGAARAEIDALLAPVRAAGLEPVGVAAGPDAIARSLQTPTEQPSDPLLVISLADDADPAATLISVVAGARPWYVRSLSPCALRDNPHAPAMGPDAWTDDLRRATLECLHYLAHGLGRIEPPTRGCVIAPEPLAASLAAALSSDVGLTWLSPIDAADPPSRALLRALPAHDEAWLAALGLALSSADAPPRAGAA